MRIALIAEWLDTNRGGAETSASQFIDELVARDVAVEVFTRSEPSSKPGTKVHTYVSRSPTRAGRTRAYLHAAEAWAQQARCDLVHALVPCAGADTYQPRGGLVPETIARTIASRPPGLPRLWKRLDLLLNRRQRLLLEKERSWLTGPHKPTVIAISEYVVRQLRRHYDYPDSHIRHILNGVNVETVDPDAQAATRSRLRHQHGLGGRDFLALQVCHNFRLKGVPAAIRAVARAREARQVPITLLVVGRGRHRPFAKLARQLKVGKYVRFAGPVERVADLFHAADVLIHPTYYDPCSRVVLEGLACGLPVISTRFDGASEIIEEGVSGFVARSPDAVEELAGFLVTLSNRAAAQQTFSRSSGMQRQVSMSRHAEEVWALYQQLV